MILELCGGTLPPTAKIAKEKLNKQSKKKTAKVSSQWKEPQIESHTSEGEKSIANYLNIQSISNKGLLPKLYRECIKFKTKKKANEFYKLLDLSRYFSKEDNKMGTVYIQRLIFCYKENAN